MERDGSAVVDGRECEIWRGYDNRTGRRLRAAVMILARPSDRPFAIGDAVTILPDRPNEGPARGQLVKPLDSGWWLVKTEQHLIRVNSDRIELQEDSI